MRWKLRRQRLSGPKRCPPSRKQKVWPLVLDFSTSPSFRLYSLFFLLVTWRFLTDSSISLPSSFLSPPSLSFEALPGHSVRRGSARTSRGRSPTLGKPNPPPQAPHPTWWGGPALILLVGGLQGWGLCCPSVAVGLLSRGGGEGPFWGRISSESGLHPLPPQREDPAGGTFPVSSDRPQGDS